MKAASSLRCVAGRRAEIIVYSLIALALEAAAVLLGLALAAGGAA